MEVSANFVYPIILLKLIVITNEKRRRSMLPCTGDLTENKPGRCQKINAIWRHEKLDYNEFYDWWLSSDLTAQLIRNWRYIYIWPFILHAGVCYMVGGIYDIVIAICFCLFKGGHRHTFWWKRFDEMVERLESIVLFSQYDFLLSREIC